MAEREQFKPLNLADYRSSREEDRAISQEFKKRGGHRCLRCCGCITALILILVTVSLVLSFTLFHLKSPTIKLNSIDVVNSNGTLGAQGNGSNVTVKVDISIENPNAATFKYGESTTDVYYHEIVVGKGRIPPGKAKGRTTLRMNFTVDVIKEKVLQAPSFSNDTSSGGEINISIYTRINGRVKIISRRHVVVKMNCSFTIDIKSFMVKDQRCVTDV